MLDLGSRSVSLNQPDTFRFRGRTSFLEKESFFVSVRLFKTHTAVLCLIGINQFWF